MARSNPWSDLAYRPLEAPWSEALELFGFAGAWAPPPGSVESGWGAWNGSRFLGALLIERAGPAAMLHGPVVLAPSDVPPEQTLDAAARLVAEALGQVQAAGIATVFTRPQGLDRIWVRSGFIPVPEAELPAGFRGRPGLGLFGWRGGTALWSTAGRGTPRSAATTDSR